MRPCSSIGFETTPSTSGSGSRPARTVFAGSLARRREQLGLDGEPDKCRRTLGFSTRSPSCKAPLPCRLEADSARVQREAETRARFRSSWEGVASSQPEVTLPLPSTTRIVGVVRMAYLAVRSGRSLASITARGAL